MRVEDDGVSEREFIAHVARAQLPGARGDWSVHDDLYLVSWLLRGRALPEIAETLGCEVAICRARWFELYPAWLHRLDRQALLVRVLRQAAGCQVEVA